MKKKSRLILGLCAMLVICVMMRLGMERSFGMMLESTLGDQCTLLITDAVEEALAKHPERTELITIQKNDAGMIASVTVDDAMLNQIAQDALFVLQNGTDGLANVTVDIPIGDLFFSQLFAGRGFCVSAQATPASGIDVRFSGGLSEAGINQVLFHMDMIVCADMEILFGFRRYSVVIERNVPVCDIVIVGSVPQTYMNLPAGTDFLNLLP